MLECLHDGAFALLGNVDLESRENNLTVIFCAVGGSRSSNRRETALA